MMPFFMQMPVEFIKNNYGKMSSDLKWGLAITLGIIMIVLAILSVVKVEITDSKGHKTCTTGLGEKTKCSKD